MGSAGVSYSETYAEIVGEYAAGDISFIAIKKSVTLKTEHEERRLRCCCSHSDRDCSILGENFEGMKGESL